VPLTPDIDMVSVDDHICEPPTVWTDRLPRRFWDRCPHVVEVAEDTTLDVGLSRPMAIPAGSQLWKYEDLAIPTVGLSATAGTDPAELTSDPLRFEQMRPGAWNPVERLADMDTDGVAIQTPFPTLPGFAGNKFIDGKDKDLALLCVRAYNDFILDEWCAAAPTRYIGLIILPLWDMELSEKEIERCAPKGARGISFPDNPSSIGLPAFHSGTWQRLFSAIEAAQLPLCLHFGSSRISPYVSMGANQAVLTALFGITLFNSMAELSLSRVFDDHPQLKIVYAEGGIGWIPYAMMRLDQAWSTYKTAKEGPPLNPNEPPSERIRRNIWGCFIDDPLGIESRETIGIDRLLWESDYPHADSLWPRSRSNAERVFADVPTEDVRRIVELNARNLFRLP
jgi:predicted TIM-barrel fold metal-dependent hydrolase